MLRHPVRAAVFVLALLTATGADARSRHAHARPAPPTVEPMIAAAEPVAVKAGMEVLKRGGNAVDAAVTIQAVLALIEPQSSSLAGGAFMMYYDAKTGEITDYTGRETAPAGATPDMFMGPDGKPLPFAAAVVSGRATGVPGALFMLDRAQKDHGRLPWSSLFGTATQLADQGFVVTPRLGNYLQTTKFDFPQKHTPDVATYFSDGHGGLVKPGDIMHNPAYAKTLRALASGRTEVFRKGPIAEAIVARTHDDPLPGTMTLDDIAGYKVIATTVKPYAATTDYNGKPLCVSYRIYIVCTNNVPSGGIALLQGLKLAETQPLDQWGVHDPRAWQALIEDERLMYADRDQYEGDTPLFDAQKSAYLDPDYIKSRAAGIVFGQAGPAPTAGNLPVKVAADHTLEPGGTTHIVIRDTFGNVVSMTTTVESIFGTGRMVDGFFLNNQLTDFSFSPVTVDGLLTANAVASGKHPRSSMSPVIVFDKTGKTVVAAIGSPGGSQILAYNLKAIIGFLDWKLPMQAAIDLPNVVARGNSIRVEKDRMEPAVWDGLTKMGYQLTASAGEESGLNGFVLGKAGAYNGGSDPRREGVFIKGTAKR
ncbi:MAG TPA: gamma-glutamyltransferase family protein [Asticcacaulis sp.]|nr:gamma-glutamyltransferase family protein [Asticcacaulis sp.]